MAVEHLYGSKLDAYFDPTTPPGAKVGSGVMGTPMRVHTDTVEVTATATSGSTYTLARINSNDRIIGGLSKVYFDDLTSSGATTADIGLYAVNGNITSDVDALNDGINVATAAGSASVVKNIADYGKMAWQYVNGQTSDPGGQFDVKVSLQDSNAVEGGTVTLELVVSQG
jgi:hypothetical protein